MALLSKAGVVCEVKVPICFPEDFERIIGGGPSPRAYSE